MRLRAVHWIGIALLLLGIIGVVVVQFTGFGRADRFQPRNLTVVTGVVGSEKLAFFRDPQCGGLRNARLQGARKLLSGSWRMAELDSITERDFAFPASEIAAQHITETHKGEVRATHKPFFSPLAIATFEPVMQLLEQNQVASKDAQNRWRIDMAAYLDLVKKDTRWNQLPGASGLYNSPRSVMITSTDVRSSNSAGMYLALSSFVLNGTSVMTTQSQAEPYLDLLTHLFLAQGYAGASSAAPFEDYLSQGMGAVPMVFGYEGQFLEEQLSERSRIRQGMVLAYPDPTIFSVHTGVTFSDEGEQVMQLLETDPQLATLLARHGFRPTGQNAAAFDDFLAEQQLTGTYPAAGDFVNLAQEPSYEMLDYLLEHITQAYDVSGAPPPAAESDNEPMTAPQNTQGGTAP